QDLSLNLSKDSLSEISAPADEEPFKLDDFSVDLDEFEPAAEAASADADDDGLELSEEFADSGMDAERMHKPDITHFEPEEAVPPTDKSDEHDDITELSLEDFGLSDDSPAPKAASEDDSGMSSVDLSEFGLGDDEDEQASAASEENDGFDSLDIDLEFDDTIPSPVESAPEEDIDFSLDEVEELGSGVAGLEAIDAPHLADTDGGISMEDVTAEFSGKAQFGSAPSSKPEETRSVGVDSFIDDESASDDDSILPELELEEVSLDPKAKISKSFDDVGALERELGSAPAAAGPSSDLLKTIASELASIKSELVSLRGQLDVLKRTEPSDIKTEPEAEAAGGFFDDEEDDTIALTGDELNNILNTADFTEESAHIEDRADQSVPSAAGSGLLPEDGDYLSLENSLSDHLPDEILPVTEAPEDTSYLEEENLDEFSLDTSSLSENELVEPDLSGLDLAVEPEIVIDDSDLVIDADDDKLEVLEELEADDDNLEELVSEEPDMDDMVLSIDASDMETSADDESLEVIEELEASDEFGLEELEAEDDLSGDLLMEAAEDINLEAGTIKPASPVSVHPDELSMSLDDSLFVEPDQHVIEMSSPPLDISMPAMGSGKDDFVQEAAQPSQRQVAPSGGKEDVPDKLKHDVKSVLLYLDQLLASLPEEKIEEFASSQYYDTYKKLFDELGLL
ncbi:MAG TPA: hypothetical protein PLC54_02515, partial [Spirochaetales bacterium]|nr:hypothetical protein [Spirochaetales bacterium]